MSKNNSNKDKRDKDQKGMRSWIIWVVACTWLATFLAVLILSRIHPPATVGVSLYTRELSFRTDANEVLSPMNEDQLIITRIAKIRVDGQKMRFSFDHGSPKVEDLIELSGLPGATCSFYLIRSSPITLSDRLSQITFWKPIPNSHSAFAFKSHGSLTGSLTGQPSTSQERSGFSCTRVSFNNQEFRQIDAMFQSPGDSVHFYTAADTQLDFRLSPASDVEDTQIPVLSTLRFSHVTPGSEPQEKAVLVPPPSGQKNARTFDGLDHTVEIPDADLLLIRPQSNFYLKRIDAKDSIEVNFHGNVQEVQLGAGSSDLRSVMPSLFDHLSTQKKVYGVVPGIVAIIFGILDKMKILPRGSGKDDGPTPEKTDAA